MRASPREANNQARLGHRQICKILLSALAGFTINALNNSITSKLIGADPLQLFYKQ